MTRTTKHWLVGGSIGAAALVLSYEIGKRRATPAHVKIQHQHEHARKHEGRGEYGKKEHHHKGHHHG
jgi:hypothetical protein